MNLPAKRLAGDAAPAPPTGVQVGDIGPDGRLVGVDGMLDQIGDALRRQAEPLLQTMILPYVSRDRGLQQAVGRAAGEAIADRAEPWVALAAGSLAVLAVVALARHNRDRRRRE